jgi:predicted MFS family arabinose efflux permease
MGSTGYGILSAAHGAGSMLGTLIIATAAQRILRPGKLMLTAATCMGVALMMFSRAPGMSVAIPMLALTGFCSTFYLTHVTMIIQQTVPDHLRGRVLSLYSLCWNLLPLGGLVAGALAAVVDARFAVLVGGALVSANALVLATSRRLRSIG